MGCDMKFLALSVLLFLNACATTEPPTQEEPSATETVKMKKSEPFILGDGTGGMSSKAANSNLGLAVAPIGTLRVSKITRPRAEMREGPGVSFALVDRILEEGDKVIVFEQHGVWAKVITIGHWEPGWLHAHTLSTPRLNKQAMTVDFAKFPTVLAIKPVDRALAFKSQDGDLEVAIPKGKMFKALQVTENKTLIWMAEKNAMVWIKGKDMQ
jgi:hypothetical protein